MLVISWNLKAAKGLKAERLEALCRLLAEEEPDLLLLQEVATDRNFCERVGECLAEQGIEHFVPPLEGARGKSYGSALASPWPLQVASPGWCMGVPWPQLLGRAQLDHQQWTVDAWSVHVPNGLQHGWKKVETLEVLGALLRHAPDAPRIVAGDFNEPKTVTEDGRFIPFAQKVDATGRIDPRGRKRDKRSGKEHPRARWDLAVASVLDAEHWTGLRHAHLSVNGHADLPATHHVEGKSRFVDHLFVSRHFEIEAAGYHTEWLKKGLSNHAAAWARVNLRDGA